MRAEASCLVENLDRALAELVDQPENHRYAVAFSGGLDSTVMLVAMSQLIGRWPAASLRAIHVNHGLHPDADDWVERSAAAAGQVDVPFLALRCHPPADGPQGFEAEARIARYRAFESVLEDGEILLSAHHGDDQLETFLLQMLRGSGPAGLASMPARKSLGRGYLVRPFLGMSREQLANWAEAQGLSWIDDPSNDDDRHARNHLRHDLIPVLLQRWPAARESVARSAELCAAAADMLTQLARMDTVNAADPVKRGNTLDLSALRGLPEIRFRNALRVWIGDSGYAVPGYAKLHDICAQILHARPDSTPCIRWEGAEIRRYRQRLYLSPPLAAPPDVNIAWQLTRTLDLPDGLGSLQLVAASDERPGLADQHLQRLATVRFREGGEAFRPVNAQSLPQKTRPLKKWLQERGIPPWQRRRWPLVYLGEELAWVPGLGPASQFAAQPGEKAKVVNWQAGDSAHPIDRD